MIYLIMIMINIMNKLNFSEEFKMVKIENKNNITFK